MKLCDVMLVDNDAFTRATVSQSLERFNIHVVINAASAADALAQLDDTPVEVALLDLDLGIGPSGIDLAHALRARQENIGLVMLTSYRDPRLAAAGSRALPIGTSYLSKRDVSDMQTVVEEILSVRRMPLQRRLSSVDSEKTLEKFTPTQIEILRMVGEGLSTSEIAVRRGVSEKAVEQSISRIYELLDLSKEKSMNQRVQLVQAFYLHSGKLDSNG